MASGTPVVTSNVSSLPEVAGDAAVLVDPYDVGVDRRRACARVLTDPALRRRAAAARARARARVLVGAVGRAGRARSTSAVARDRSRSSAPLKVALVHDWLTGMRGGEKVLEALCELYPGRRHLHARSPPRLGVAADRAAPRSARRSCSGCRCAARALPAATCRSSRSPIEQFDLDALRPGDQLEPLRRQGGRRAGPRAARLLLPLADALRVGSVRRVLRPGAGRARWRAAGCYRPVLARLARWDAATAGRVHRFVANSSHVAGRIRRYYNREATVVYPPVDTVFLPPDAGPAPEPSLSHRVRARAVQAARPRDRGLRAGRRAAAIVGDGPERAAAASARGRRRDVEFLGLARRTTRSATSTGAPRRCSCPARRTSASCRSRPRPAAARSSRSAAAARSKPSWTARPACCSTSRRSRRSPPRCATCRARDVRPAAHPRATPSGSRASASETSFSALVDDTLAAPRARDGKTLQPAARRLLRRQRRAARRCAAFVLAYGIRFETRPDSRSPRATRRSSSTCNIAAVHRRC